tara:strand:- start:627 stop:1649 length:1023 start_codon:yes stop_codon:yes gene_type:complete
MSKEYFSLKCCPSNSPEYNYLEGYLNNNIRTGLWTYYYDKGLKQKQGKYKVGELDGKWVWWYKNQIIKAEVNFMLGKKHGKMTLYDIDGNKWLTGDYVFGKLQDQFLYYSQNSPNNRPGSLNYDEINDKFYEDRGALDILFKKWFKEFLQFEIITHSLVYNRITGKIDVGDPSDYKQEEPKIVEKETGWGIYDYDIEFDLFVDEEEKEKLIFYSIGAIQYLNEFLKSLDSSPFFKEDNNATNGLISNESIPWIATYPMKLLPKNFRKTFKDIFIASKYNNNELKMINMGRSDIESWLQREKFVIQSFCECEEYCQFSKNLKKVKCKKCHTLFSFVDKIYK